MTANTERELAEQGRLIEAGWIAFRSMALAKETSPAVLDQCRDIFFAGAAHLFSTVTTVLDPGDDPTENDLLRMSQIEDELRSFIVKYSIHKLPVRGRA